MITQPQLYSACMSVGDGGMLVGAYHICHCSGADFWADSQITTTYMYHVIILTCHVGSPKSLFPLSFMIPGMTSTLRACFFID